MGRVLTRISISISIFYIDCLIYPGFGCLHCACRSLRDIHESYREHSRWLLMLSNRSRAYHGVFFLGVYGHPMLNTKWGCWRMFWSLHSMQLQWLETEAFENQIILIHELIISHIQLNEVIYYEWIIHWIVIHWKYANQVHTGQNDSFIIDLLLKSSSLTLNDYISACSSKKAGFREHK